MNTITKSTVLEADKLATLYAGKLREAGNSPSNCLGVTSDKVLPMEFQNGVLCRSMLPVGKLADWARTFPGETEFQISFSPECQSEDFDVRKLGKVKLSATYGRYGNTAEMTVCFAGSGENYARTVADVPAIRFDDAGGSRQDFQLLKPAGLENLSAGLKAAKALKEFDRARASLGKASQDLRAVAKEHCANLETLAGGIAGAIGQARLIVKARRMLRAALKNPAGVIGWLGESITPAGEYDAGPSVNLTPEHAELVAAIVAANAARDLFYHSKRFKSVRSPKYTMLSTAVTSAKDNLNRWILKAWEAECEKNGLDCGTACFDGEGNLNFYGTPRPYSRARLAVAGYAAKKHTFAQDFIRALDLKRKAERKAVSAGAIVIARATLPDGTSKGKQWCAVENMAEQVAKAAELGAVVEIIESNLPAYPMGIIGAAPVETAPVNSENISENAPVASVEETPVAVAPLPAGEPQAAGDTETPCQPESAPVVLPVEHITSEPEPVPVSLGKAVELYPCDFWPLVRQVVAARGATEAFPLALGNVDFWQDGETCAYSIPANTWDINRVATDLTRYLTAPKVETTPANFACY